MDSNPHDADSAASDPIEACRFRLPLVGPPDPDRSRCDLLRHLLPELADESWVVPRSVCAACCRTFPPSAAVWNPVMASLVLHHLTQSQARRPIADRAERVRRAERALDFDVPHTVRASDADPISRAQPIRLGLRDALALPRQRCGPPVESWAVGVTTAPRRRPTLERCLHSLSAAGWRAPHLFVDGSIRVPEPYRDLPATWRNPPVGAWPNFYLALAELLL
ncbi:MAG: hypothetical protein AB7F89_23485, partial [Pirellulaceae bacterium]